MTAEELQKALSDVPDEAYWQVKCLQLDVSHLTPDELREVTYEALRHSHGYPLATLCAGEYRKKVSN